ncbi:MAG: hypothetical protein H6679_05075 [Epsilonproteobacteria bacterium]|nr:hypothetical protein [Campylobacterota bacterium]
MKKRLCEALLRLSLCAIVLMVPVFLQAEDHKNVADQQTTVGHKNPHSQEGFRVKKDPDGELSGEEELEQEASLARRQEELSVLFEDFLSDLTGKPQQDTAGDDVERSTQDSEQNPFSTGGQDLVGMLSGMREKMPELAKALLSMIEMEEEMRRNEMKQSLPEEVREKLDQAFREYDEVIKKCGLSHHLQILTKEIDEWLASCDRMSQDYKEHIEPFEKEYSDFCRALSDGSFNTLVFGTKGMSLEAIKQMIEDLAYGRGLEEGIYEKQDLTNLLDSIAQLPVEEVDKIEDVMGKFVRMLHLIYKTIEHGDEHDENHFNNLLKVYFDSLAPQVSHARSILSDVKRDLEKVFLESTVQKERTALRHWLGEVKDYLHTLDELMTLKETVHFEWGNVSKDMLWVFMGGLDLASLWAEMYFDDHQREIDDRRMNMTRLLYSPKSTAKHFFLTLIPHIPAVIWKYKNNRSDLNKDVLTKVVQGVDISLMKGMLEQIVPSKVSLGGKNVYTINRAKWNPLALLFTMFGSGLGMLITSRHSLKSAMMFLSAVWIYFQLIGVEGQDRLLSDGNIDTLEAFFKRSIPAQYSYWKWASLRVLSILKNKLIIRPIYQAIDGVLDAQDLETIENSTMGIVKPELAAEVITTLFYISLVNKDSPLHKHIAQYSSGLYDHKYSDVRYEKNLEKEKEARRQGIDKKILTDEEKLIHKLSPRDRDFYYFEEQMLKYCLGQAGGFWGRVIGKKYGSDIKAGFGFAGRQALDFLSWCKVIEKESCDEAGKAVDKNIEGMRELLKDMIIMLFNSELEWKRMMIRPFYETGNVSEMPVDPLEVDQCIVIQMLNFFHDCQLLTHLEIVELYSTFSRIEPGSLDKFADQLLTHVENNIMGLVGSCVGAAVGSEYIADRVTKKWGPGPGYWAGWYGGA